MDVRLRTLEREAINDPEKAFALVMEIERTCVNHCYHTVWGTVGYYRTIKRCCHCNLHFETKQHLKHGKYAVIRNWSYPYPGQSPTYISDGEQMTLWSPKEVVMKKNYDKDGNFVKEEL